MRRANVPMHVVKFVHDVGSGCSFSTHALPILKSEEEGAEFRPHMREIRMSKSLKKIVEESREKNVTDIDMSDRGIGNMLDIPGLFSLSHITQLILSHNKLTIGQIVSTEVLWLPLLVECVSDCFLDICHVSSLPHDCGAY
ncbi:unnamed protein product [Ranitomeya imitator]|uniref:Uncharacterized protein n=1 Tax=Ranitomeya imitator TaxID=111125 RepID=A0ABN9ME88_9NEOB|nr:unnamed protein product [Ranitomeya imitator]